MSTPASGRLSKIGCVEREYQSQLMQIEQIADIHSPTPTIRGSTMNSLNLPIITAAALILGVFLLSEEAVAQTMAKNLVGTWTLVSLTVEQGGKMVDYFGSNPQGQAIFEPNGSFSMIISRSDLPKFAYNDREAGTAKENKVVVQGSIANFGTYSVNETDKAVTLHIECSTYPNWKGVDHKRVFTLSGNTLSWTNPTPSRTEAAQLVWKRAQ